MLNFDVGKETKKAKGVTPTRLKSAIQTVGRSLYRLASGGAGPAKKEWGGTEFENGTPEILDAGGIVILDVTHDGQDYNVVGTIMVPTNSKVEKDRKVVALGREVIAESQKSAAEAAKVAPATP